VQKLTVKTYINHMFITQFKFWLLILLIYQSYMQEHNYFFLLPLCVIHEILMIVMFDRQVHITGQVGAQLGALAITMALWMSQLRVFIDQYGEEGYYGGNYFSGKWTLPQMSKIVQESTGADMSIKANVDPIVGYDVLKLTEPQISHLEAFRPHLKAFLSVHANFFMISIVLITVAIDIYFIRLMFTEYLITLE
jgi:hypothetical protein